MNGVSSAAALLALYLLPCRFSSQYLVSGPVGSGLGNLNFRGNFLHSEEGFFSICLFFLRFAGAFRLSYLPTVPALEFSALACKKKHAKPRIGVKKVPRMRTHGETGLSGSASQNCLALGCTSPPALEICAPQWKKKCPKPRIGVTKVPRMCTRNRVVCFRF